MPLTESNKFLHDFTERSFSLLNLKSLVILCIFAISIPIDLQFKGDKFCFALPSRKETIINFLPSKSVIVLFCLLIKGEGHLKLDLFNDDMRLEKNGSRLDAANGDASSSCTRCFTASHHNADANMLRNKNYSVVTARAFKPLATFLDILDKSNIKFKKLILLKGEKYENEILDAEKYWEIKCELHDSITNKASKVFVINSVKRISG